MSQELLCFHSFSWCNALTIQNEQGELHADLSARHQARFYDWFVIKFKELIPQRHSQTLTLHTPTGATTTPIYRKIHVEQKR